ncbi:MAG: hypothetical protein Q9205_008038, partial [Flavoplaca limonia]
LNHRIIIETCDELGYSGSDFDSGRQVIRVAAGLPPGRADHIDDEPTRRDMPATQRINDPRARQIEQRPSREDQYGGHEVSRRGPRETQYDDDVEEHRQAIRRRHDEDGYGAGPQGPRRGAIYLDELEDPREMRGGTHLANRHPQPDMAKGWKDTTAQNENSAKLPKGVSLSKGPQVWGDDILPKDTMRLIEDRLPVAAEAEVRAACEVWLDPAVHPEGGMEARNWCLVDTILRDTANADEDRHFAFSLNLLAKSSTVERQNGWKSGALLH